MILSTFAKIQKIMRDGANTSLWEGDIKFETPSKKEIYDAVIVGGGITGITTAYELQKKGLSVAVLERGCLGFGTTGGTTAHINNFFDTPYYEMIESLGEEKAKIIAQNAKKVLPYIKDNIFKNQISCEIGECSNFLFSAEEKQNKELEKIEESLKQVGLDVKKAYQIPFTVKFENAIEILGQGQFHPAKYIKGLAKTIVANAGDIFTETAVVSHEKSGENIKISTENHGEFLAKNLIWATHIPPGNNRFSVLAAPYRSYVMALELENPPKELAQAADLYDPYHYFRYHAGKEKNYLIVGGFDHKTGESEEQSKNFDDLQKYIDENFKYKKVAFRWSSQYYTPADGLPYIGKMPGEENIFVATGYDGNGMTWSAIAAFIFSDLIQNKENPLAEILSPSRIDITGSAKSVIAEGTDAAIKFVKDKLFTKKIKSYDEIENGTGKVVEIDGETAAVYKDDSGKISAVSAVCTHLGCNVVFNDAEKTWDCPCHGSRFSTDGKVLCGPAEKDLESVNI